MENNLLPKVTIRCVTYNHAPYIRECLEGFVMQKTNFPFEVIVHDDASTDGTSDIIREYAERYPELIKPIFQKENQYSKWNGEIDRVLNAATRGKYIAICEGDDYWTDPMKLQRQVDFLEANPDYGMCYTQCLSYYQEYGQLASEPWGGKTVTFEDLLLKPNNIPTATVMFRSELLNQCLSELDSIICKLKMGDLPLWLYISKKSLIGFIPVPTAVYRILQYSVSHFRNLDQAIAFVESTKDAKIFFLENKGENVYYMERVNDVACYDSARFCVIFKDRMRARNYLKKIRRPTFKSIVMSIFTYLPFMFEILSRRIK